MAESLALVPDKNRDLDSSRGCRLVETFLAGRNKRTKRAYLSDLSDFAFFLGLHNARDAASFLVAQEPGRANELVLHYRAHLVDRGLSASTVNRRMASLRAMVKLARTLGIVPWSLEVSNLKSEPYRDTRGPGRKGFCRILKKLEGRSDAKGKRDRAILRLLFDLALRREEVVRLDVADVDLATRKLDVLGKGRTAKVKLTLPKPTKEALAAWLEARGTEPGPLFTNFDRAGKGHRLSATSVYRLVRDLGLKVGVKARPHGLRHAAITEALDLTGGDVRKVARFSRHKDLRTLSVYDDAREDLGGEVAALVAESVKAQ